MARQTMSLARNADSMADARISNSRRCSGEACTEESVRDQYKSTQTKLGEITIKPNSRAMVETSIAFCMFRCEPSVMTRTIAPTRQCRHGRSQAGNFTEEHAEVDKQKDQQNDCFHVCTIFQYSQRIRLNTRFRQIPFPQLADGFHVRASAVHPAGLRMPEG